MDKPKKGFTVSDTGIEEQELKGVQGVVETMHAALDILLAQIRDNDLGGAKIVVTAKSDCEHTEHPDKQFTMTLYESTGQKDCVWCNGTGVEGS